MRYQKVLQRGDFFTMQIKHKKKEYGMIRDPSLDEYEIKKNSEKKNMKMLKLMPYVNNDHMNNVYKIYSYRN